jgi:hypothetical protein
VSAPNENGLSRLRTVREIRVALLTPARCAPIVHTQRLPDIYETGESRRMEHGDLELEALEAHVMLVLGTVPGALPLNVIAAMAEANHDACKVALVNLMLLGKVVESLPGRFTIAETMGHARRA